ncbi:MAG: flagellar export chaperone FlgN [Chloroflexi bacterium]|nr:flagellar export chaperone FlgN [Chloroflexota bacterium]
MDHTRRDQPEPPPLEQLIQGELAALVGLRRLIQRQREAIAAFQMESYLALLDEVEAAMARLQQLERRRQEMVAALTPEAATMPPPATLVAQAVATSHENAALAGLVSSLVEVTGAEQAFLDTLAGRNQYGPRRSRGGAGSGPRA